MRLTEVCFSLWYSYSFLFLSMKENSIKRTTDRGVKRLCGKWMGQVASYVTRSDWLIKTINLMFFANNLSP